MPYYQRLDTGETSWRPPATPARAAGAIRVSDAHDDSPIDAGEGGRRYLVGLFVSIPVRMPGGVGGGSAALPGPPGQAKAAYGSSSLHLLPGQVPVDEGRLSGFRLYTEARKAGGGGSSLDGSSFGGASLGGTSGVWMAQEDAAAAAVGGGGDGSVGGSRVGSSGGTGGRARIQYDGNDGQVHQLCRAANALTVFTFCYYLKELPSECLGKVTASGRRHGLGMLVCADGVVYRGRWRGDQPTGLGVENYPDGAILRGAAVAFIKR